MGKMSNQIITNKRHLAKYRNEEQNDWDIYLQHTVHSINTSKQRSTMVSPFFAVYGLHPNSSADPQLDDFVIDDSEEIMQRRADLLAEVHAKVQENI